MFISRFTDKTKIERAEKQAAKVVIMDETHHQSPKKLRSKVPPVNTTRRNEHVLPEQCIICRKDKYVVQKHDRKRMKEKLSTCEYESGEYSSIDLGIILGLRMLCVYTQCFILVLNISLLAFHHLTK